MQQINQGVIKVPDSLGGKSITTDPNCNQTIEGTFPRTQICMDKWTELTDDQEILDIVSGYQLDFSEIPHQQKLLTPFNLSKEEERLVDLEVEKLLRKGGIEEVEPCENQFLFRHFHDTQEGWREKAGGRHEGLEQFHRTSSFQNGGSVTLAISPPEGGFYVQDRLKRRVSNNSNCKKIKDLPKVSLERETLPVHMSTFQPQVLSKNFHKGSETLLVYLRALGV